MSGSIQYQGTANYSVQTKVYYDISAGCFAVSIIVMRLRFSMGWKLQR